MKTLKVTSFFILFSCLLCLNTLNAQQNKIIKTQQLGINPSNINPENGLIRCSTVENEAILQANDPKRLNAEQFEAWLAPLIEKYKLSQQVSSQSGGIIYIPVVVHVIHNGDAYGTNENITDEQVQSQITVMTQDYRRLTGTPGFNSNAVGADVQIEFVLAKVDPNGNPTNGIDRVNLCTANYNAGSFTATQNLIDTTVKPVTIWDATLYMNMWSVNWDGSGLLGYAQFPSSSGLSGLDANGGAANTDGVVAGHSYFGSRTLAPTGNFADNTYDKGRTMTHEVGHFLGLVHIWGDSNCGTDYCADTPTAHDSNYNCPTVINCSNNGNEMVQNYMDYTDDSCMNIFTNNQKTRMITVMNNSPRRTTLKTSTKDLPIPLFAIDAEVKIENSCATLIVPTCSNPNPILPVKIISLYNRGTSNLTSASISYTINGGPNYTNNWTGNLAPNKFAYINLANTGSNGVLNVTITSANGTTDQRATNNTATKTFAGSTSSIANYNYTAYTFNLVGDAFGTEITWNIKNAAGTTLYSGGPYTNLASQNGTQNLVTNQNWNLPANGCYTFTINDSYGDGICCAFGSGQYQIKTNNGATTVASNTNFTSLTESKSFTNSTLSTTDFQTFNDLYLYPNPSKTVINIAIPNSVYLPKNITVYNNLGQVIDNKKVNSSGDLSLNTSLYSNGIYFITVANDTQTKTLQFIKE